MISKEKVEQVVFDWANKGFAFTAYDVTSFLRKKGETCRHIHVNEHVKEIYTDGEIVYNEEARDYMLSVKPIQGVSLSPLLYHHDSDGFDNYDPDWVENYEPENDSLDDIQDEPEALDSGIDSDSIVPTLSVQPDSQVVRLSSDGRLNIPQKYLGGMSRASVYVSPQNDFVEITAPSPTSRGGSIPRNADGRIRLYSCIMRQIKTSSNLFNVARGSDGKITVTAV